MDVGKVGEGCKQRWGATERVVEVVAPEAVIMVARRGRGVSVVLAKAGDGERVRCEKGAVGRKYLAGDGIFRVGRSIDASGQN